MVVVGVVCALMTALSTPFAAAEPSSTPAPTLRSCPVPNGTSHPQTATPAQVGIDAAKLRTAIAFASSRLRTNVQIYRNNCLVGEGPFNPVTDGVPWNLWSGTKSVVSMVAGVAYSEGRLRLDAPIGDYLPAGLGDAAHRAITVRDLLTQTSGLKQSIVSEGIPAALDLDIDVVKQALALPILHRPGTFFEYGQHNGDLLAFVVGRAVGEDVQRYAQDKLFGPVGIGPRDWFWNRDRSGNTYGYAFLYMPPDDFARLGLLMLNGGEWNGRRVISTDYVDQARTPTTTNPCYGYLFWLNRGPCTGPSIPSRQTVDAAPFQGLPADTYAMVGLAQQNNFIMPGLGIVVSWTGAFGDVSPDPITTLSGSLNSELYHSFLRLFAASLTSPRLPDPGPYRPTFNLTIDPDEFADPSVALGAFGLGPYAPPGCTVTRCGSAPLRAPLQGNPGCFALACLPVPGAPQRPR
ncbi:CubicO group peptidase, beta-lactamase class C family [Williamsia serinedens]|uniref:CubicO group peptidase, beta-lactamase class C family n=3 Tax=Williamsia serinedens TaxID=391736 RepID=A0ABT1GZ53_9NOCA|nr:CubicO group peptidase, beta-lactamase class C family [Williamsia serinedens]